MRILLAEDERSLSRAVIALLEKNNYSADAVYDGQEALEYLEAGNYDALILDLICCNMILKPLVGRIRPFAVNTAVELLTAPPADASFPSGHTAASFAAVFALRASGSPLWKPAAVLASVIAFSRLYLYVHWPTDVLGGILVGAAAGWAGARLADALRRRRERLGRRA